MKAQLTFGIISFVSACLYDLFNDLIDALNYIEVINEPLVCRINLVSEV